jgi:hypothetical protein
MLHLCIFINVLVYVVVPNKLYTFMKKVYIKEENIKRVYLYIGVCCYGCMAWATLIQQEKEQPICTNMMFDM